MTTLAGTTRESPGINRDIEVKIASDRQEWEQAIQFVAANYRVRGYEIGSSGPLRFTPYHALPDTQALDADHNGHVVATFSVVRDNTLLGPPAESMYAEEIAVLRSKRHRLLEPTSLADTGLSVRDFLQVFAVLIKLGMPYHTAHGGVAFVITVKPRHKSFDSEVLDLLPLRPCHSYAWVEGGAGRHVLGQWRPLEAAGSTYARRNLWRAAAEVRLPRAVGAARPGALLRPPVGPRRRQDRRGGSEPRGAVREPPPLVIGEAWCGVGREKCGDVTDHGQADIRVGHRHMSNVDLGTFLPERWIGRIRDGPPRCWLLV
jgi:hypothetical protein